MSENPVTRKMERMVSAYFDACRKQDPNAIAACFVPDGVHYLPHHSPIVGGGTIAAAIVQDLHGRGGQYFVDKIFTDVEHWVAAVEWSRTFKDPQRILRGYEVYEFDPSLALIREIRGYYAAAPNAETTRHEMLGFDYAGRGYRSP
jgi:methyltransferase